MASWPYGVMASRRCIAVSASLAAYRDRGAAELKVAIIGSRSAPSGVAVTILRRIPADATEIVSGGAAGVDAAAEEVAAALSLPVRRFLPEYERWGRAAPIKRNEAIVRYADLVLAFWDDRSKGTKHVIGECLRLHRPVQLIRLSDKQGGSHACRER